MSAHELHENGRSTGVPEPVNGDAGAPILGPRNVPLERENPDQLIAPATDAGTVPNLKYSFGAAHNRVLTGGWAREVTTRELPVATEISGVNMRLKPGGIREMHWHKEAEWSYMIAGRARISAIDSEGRSFNDDVGAGDLWYFPAGIPHAIQGLEDGCEFLLVFDEGDFSENETFLITDWFAHTPRDVLAQNFGGDNLGLRGEGGDDVLIGGPAGEFLAGDDGNDRIDGGDGGDFMRGGAGDDSLTGGPGIWDAVSYWETPNAVTASLTTNTATGEGNDTFGPGLEVLNGSQFDDTLEGGTVNGTSLNGEGGNDVLLGGPADEPLFGGAGNDRIDGGDGGDWMRGGPGDDEIVGGPGSWDSATYWDAPGPVHVSIATGTVTGEGTDRLGSGLESVSGSQFGDVFDGGPGGIWMDGSGGDDVMNGSSADEGFAGGDGNDRIDGGDGNDWIGPGAGDDIVRGGSGPFDGVAYWDAAGPVNVSLTANVATGSGSDTLDDGLEIVAGGPFDDVLEGDDGPNGLHGDPGDDVLLGRGGNDWGNGWTGDDRYYGGEGNDFFAGELGNDELYGEDGDDSLQGNEGDDMLNGGLGWDFLNGGADTDSCVEGESLFDCE